ncbi:hypothetical protein NP233_g9878 [Leucocoprinus birnbaumii]|uniref:Methyltransferase domain-containing protein n=1 Tax=Leucocoprinus birnbaumii TaxID=56174 RepID=A0AAD5YSF4_9AGAR|nr:hypothetical protein NP233_g9878 [Leucocoprinus birnbaumii]
MDPKKPIPNPPPSQSRPGGALSSHTWTRSALVTPPEQISPLSRQHAPLSNTAPLNASNTEDLQQLFNQHESLLHAPHGLPSNLLAPHALPATQQSSPRALALPEASSSHQTPSPLLLPISFPQNQSVAQRTLAPGLSSLPYFVADQANSGISSPPSSIASEGGLSTHLSSIKPAITQRPSPPNRLSPNRLPHPSQLPPNHWPAPGSLSDHGSPSISPSSSTRGPSSLSSKNPIPTRDPTIPGPKPSAKRSPNLPPRFSAAATTTALPKTFYSTTPSSLSNSRPPAVGSFVQNSQAMAPPVIHSNPRHQQQQHYIPPTTGTMNDQAQPELPLVEGHVETTATGPSHVQLYVNQVQRQLLVIVCNLLCGVNGHCHRIDKSDFIQRMDLLLVGRPDLFLGVGIFIPPEARHLITTRMQASASTQHDVDVGGSLSAPERYTSPTVEYMSRIISTTDVQTWALVQVILKRYYSNLLDPLIQREAQAQLEHVLRDYPSLVNDCGILLATGDQIAIQSSSTNDVLRDTTVQTHKRPLDPTLLDLEDEEARFFKQLTGIQNEKELRDHIVGVQEKAYQVYRYPCIQAFAFTKLKISLQPAYKRVLELPKTRPGAILLDIGCCFGNDLRKAVIDDWPVENAVASDLRSEFWEYGHELFKSTPKTFPAAFIPGDSFSPDLIEPRAPFYSEPTASHPTDLRTLKSLTPLQGHISAIHASSFFHLFDEEQQFLLAKQLATLLSPSPGSIIFGSHGGRPVKGLRTEVSNSRGEHMFCHSPESWMDLWDGQVFRKGSVKVEAQVVVRERRKHDPPEIILHWLVWSVTRL